MFKTMQCPSFIYLIVSKEWELLKQTVSQLCVHVVDYRNPIFCFKDFFSFSCGSENIIDGVFSIPLWYQSLKYWYCDNISFSYKDEF